MNPEMSRRSFLVTIVLAACFLILPMTAFGQQQGGATSTDADSTDALSVFRRGVWTGHESANFRILTVDATLDVPELAKAWEATRDRLCGIWLPSKAAAKWSPKCDVYLYATSRDYALKTGFPVDSPGHAYVEIGDGRVWERSLHLRIDAIGFMDRVLPHELTHIVLADEFCTRQIPRWADEGIAVLSEPMGRRQELRQTVVRAKDAGRLFAISQLFDARSYPTHGGQGALFYSQSASLVEYLMHCGGSQELVHCVKLGQEIGWDEAVRQAYGVSDVAALESRWHTWLQSQP